MAVAKNPKDLKWTDPTTYEDGSPFGAEQFKAYGVGVGPSDTGPFDEVFVLPTAYGVGESPIPDIVKQNKDAIQYLALRTIAKNDETSVWTGGVPVQFVDVPLAPSAFSVI